MGIFGEFFDSDGVDELEAILNDDSAAQEFTGESVNTEQAFIKEFETGVVNAHHPDFSGSDLSAKVNSAFTYLSNNYGFGEVLVHAGGAPYDLSERIDIPVSGEQQTSYVLRGVGGQVKFEPVSSFSGKAIRFEPNTTGSASQHNGIENISVTDPNSVLTRCLEVNDGVQYWGRNLILRSGAANPVMDVVSPNGTAQHHYYKNIRLNDESQGNIKLRLGTATDSDINQNQLFGFQIDGASGSGTGMDIAGNANLIWGFDIGAADVGVKVRGEDNRIWGRWEGGYGSGNRNVTPVQFTGGSRDNTVFTAQSSDAKTASELGGLRNEMVSKQYVTILDVTPTGANIAEEWAKTESGSASVARSLNKTTLSTGTTSGSEARVDFNGERVTNTTDAFVLTAQMRLLDTTDVRAEIGLFADSSNLVRLYYDTSSPNGVSGSNWVAESIDGGTATRDDTGVSPSGSTETYRIHARDGGHDFFIGGAQKVTHSVSIAKIMEPRLKAVNNAGADKDFEIRAGGVELEANLL